MNYKDPIKDLLHCSKGPSKCWAKFNLLGPFQYNSIQDTLFLTCCTKRQPHGVPLLSQIHCRHVTYIIQLNKFMERVP